MAIWDEFDKGLPENFATLVNKAEKNGFEYDEVPEGTYEVHIVKMEPGKTKTENPMLKIQFKIIGNSKFKGQMLFMNQVMKNETGVARAVAFLKSLDTGIAIRFESFKQFAGIISEVFNASSELDFIINYTKNSKGFPSFEISEVLDVA